MNRLAQLEQELMTPQEAARWFRRSVSWLRQQRELLRLGLHGGQPLYHVDVCRAFVFGRICRLDAQELRRVQLDALAAACQLAAPVQLLDAETAAAGEAAVSG